MTVDLGKLDEALTGESITGEDLLAAALLIAAGFLLAWLVRRWSRRLLKRLDKHAEPVVALAARVAQVLVIAVFVGWALAGLGADIGWLTLMVAVAAFIAILAARPIVEGLGAGAALTTRAAFAVGDEIGIDDTVGEVNDITSRTTVIRMRDGRHVHIPNVEMLKRTVTVYTAADERRSAVEVIVGFETDLDHVRCVLRTSLDGVEDIRRVGSIRSTVVASGIELSIRFWHSSGIESGNDAKDAAISSILSALKDAGVRFAPPTEIAMIDRRREST